MNKLADLQFLLTENIYDLILISETWLNENISNGLLISNYSYSIYRNDRNGRRGGGVAVLFKNSLKLTNVKLPDQFLNCEVVICDFYDSCKNQTRIILCYRAPNETPEYDEILARLFTWASNISCKSIIIGDFNLPNFNELNIEGILQENILQLGYSQIIDQPTRDQNLLDLLFVSSPFVVFDVFIDACFSNSDHNTIKFKINHENQYCRHNCENFINFKNLNYEGLRYYLSLVDWPLVFNQCVTIDDFYNIFLQIIFDGINMFYTKRNKTKFQNQIPFKLRKLINKKRELWRQYKNDRNQYNRSKYKSICRNIKQVQNSILSEREQSLINSGSLNNFYKFVNSRLNQKQAIPPLSLNNTLHFDDNVKANIFNEYFASVFTEDDGSTPVTENLIESDVRISFDIAAVNKALKKLKSTFSIGPDGLCAYFFKNLSDVLILPLQTIFEVSYRTGSIPAIWKTANVVPIFKKGDPSNPENYRPISLTCASCRIMESIINDSIISHLQNYNLIFDNQFGFLKNKSCALQLLSCKNKWTESLDSGLTTDVVYLDISKAFDSVSHKKLILKLKSFGFKNFLLNWLTCFLSNRSQRVKIYNTFSKNKSVQSGVPQGSVLGPTLFLIYINDISRNLVSSIYLFADDVKLFNHSSNCNCIQNDLDKISSWCNEWQLKVATQKCNVLYIGKNNPKHKYFINNSVLTSVTEIRDLGVLINDNLSFSSHCTFIMKKSLKVSGLIRKSFTSRDPNLLLQAFKTYVRPILEYSSVVWSPFLVKDINNIEKVQRRFTKTLFKNKNLTYEERLVILKLETLEKRRLYFDLCSAYDITCLHYLPSEMFFTFNKNNTRANNSFKMIVNRSTTNSRKNDFCNRIVPFWNMLPETIIRAQNRKKFYSKIRNFNFHN